MKDDIFAFFHSISKSNTDARRMVTRGLESVDQRGTDMWLRSFCYYYYYYYYYCYYYFDY